VIEKLLVEPKKDTEIAEDLDISQKQVRAWLKRLVQEGAIVKMNKPVRYLVNESKQHTLPISNEKHS
jgi:predicted transcriptional regulator